MEDLGFNFILVFGILVWLGYLNFISFFVFCKKGIVIVYFLKDYFNSVVR